MNFVYSVSVIICLCFFICNAAVLKSKKRCRGKVFFHPQGMRAYQGLDHNVRNTKIPRRFDARKKWPHCKSLFRISDQGECGGCWAFSASSVMADRLCIHSKQKKQDYVSTQDLLECCINCIDNTEEDRGGCEGGYPDEAFVYWKKNGIVSGFDRPLEGCKPIHKGIIKGKPYKTCRRKCTNKKFKKSYAKAKSFGETYFVQTDPLKNGLKQIQIELMKNGPIVASLNVYEYIGDLGENDIMSYDKDKVDKDEQPQKHAVKLIGWDETDDGTPVWIIANSWGKDWCDSGFCRVLRGVNELNIEGYDMAGGLPKVRSAAKRRRNVTEETSGSKIIFINLYVIILEIGVLFHFL